MEHIKRRKVVLVGDGTVGKTSFIIRFDRDEFIEDVVRRVDGSLESDVIVDGKYFEVALWDTPGQDEYDRVRHLAYPDTDIFLICFPVDSPTSFANIKAKWVPEIRHYRPDTPFILVGTKRDLRGATSTEPSDTQRDLREATSTEPSDTQRDLRGATSTEPSDTQRDLRGATSTEPSDTQRDLRGATAMEPSEEFVDTSAAHHIAKETGAVGYFETSALTGEGVADAVMAALRVVQSGRRKFTWPWKKKSAGQEYVTNVSESDRKEEDSSAEETRHKMGRQE